MKKLHGETTTNSRLYSIWSNMIQRCTNPKNDKYEWYGARGISVCTEWRDYLTFKDWAMISGYADELSIDRKDVNGNYSPSNCVWATSTEQCNNRRTNRVLTFNGESLTVAQWARKLGVNPKSLYNRLYKGWSVEKTLTTPIQHCV